MKYKHIQEPWSLYCKRKFIEPEAIECRIEELRAQGKSIATLNGSFDLLHAGHLYIIFEAAKQADVLIVALNSDASIRQYKGSDRPLIALKYRLEIMAALEFVDFVTWFDEEDPRAIISRIKPDVHVNGIEYGEDCIERQTVVSCGGRVVLIDRIDGLATSHIIGKIQSICASSGPQIK